jgi:hypothetical protein
MYDPQQILRWLEVHVQPMRHSRRKTLASIVTAALRMRGVGVLALGRAMAGVVGAKHCIKRVWRFLCNQAVEYEAVSRALLRCLAPPTGLLVILADWTDLNPFQQLVFALPRDGRALPFLSRTIRKDDGEGSMIAAERGALRTLAQMLPPGQQVVLIADRGFGNTRWLGDVRKWGWSFVQRIASNVTVDVSSYLGQLSGLPVPRGSRALEWGWGALTEEKSMPVRLVTVFSHDAKQPWYLVTDLEQMPAKIVQLYQRRMWIEAMFRDLKNRDGGLGLDVVRLSEPERHQRLFAVLRLSQRLRSCSRESRGGPATSVYCRSLGLATTSCSSLAVL